MRFEALCSGSVVDFHGPEHGMGHERGKTVIAVFERHLKYVFAQRTGAEAWRRRGLFRRPLVCLFSLFGLAIRRCSFDVCEQLRMRREWSDLERAFPRAHEIAGGDSLAVGPARIVAEIESPDASVLRRLPARG